MRTDTVWTKSYDRPWLVGALAVGTIATLLLLLAPKAGAQQGYGGEIRGDRNELRQDRLDRSGDWDDVRRLSRQIYRLDHAERAGNRFEARRARVAIQQLMREEIVESRRDLASDRDEARWDRDDTSPRWDDRRDAMSSYARLAGERRVVRELATIETDVARGAPWALAREQRLLRDFLRLSRQDAMASGRELREDRRELRNDLRDDRDEGRRDSGGPGDGRQDFRNDRPAPPPPPEMRDDGRDDRDQLRAAPAPDQDDQDQLKAPDRDDEDREPPSSPEDEDVL